MTRPAFARARLRIALSHLYDYRFAYAIGLSIIALTLWAGHTFDTNAYEHWKTTGSLK